VQSVQYAPGKFFKLRWPKFLTIDPAVYTFNGTAGNYAVVGYGGPSPCLPASPALMMCRFLFKFSPALSCIHARGFRREWVGGVGQIRGKTERKDSPEEEWGVGVV
jgi:hypothetical protein